MLVEHDKAGVVAVGDGGLGDAGRQVRPAGSILVRLAPSRVASEASTNRVQRTGTSLSNSLVNSLSRRADGFQAIILGGSPGM